MTVSAFGTYSVQRVYQPPSWRARDLSNVDRPTPVAQRKNLSSLPSTPGILATNRYSRGRTSDGPDFQRPPVVQNRVDPSAVQQKSEPGGSSRVQAQNVTFATRTQDNRRVVFRQTIPSPQAPSQFGKAPKLENRVVGSSSPRVGVPPAQQSATVAGQQKSGDISRMSYLNRATLQGGKSVIIRPVSVTRFLECN